jgi:hypothetical protein
MAHATDQIDCILNCSACEKQLDEAKTLPCGFAVCASCEANLHAASQATYTCKACQESHARPTADLPMNRMVAKLLEERRSALTADAMRRAAMVCEQVSVDNYQRQLGTNCAMVANEVELAVESRKAELDKQRDMLLKQIDEYQATKLSGADQMIAELNACRPNVDAIPKNNRDLQNKNHILSSDDIAKINTEINEMAAILEDRLKELKEMGLGSTRLYFCHDFENFKALGAIEERATANGFVFAYGKHLKLPADEIKLHITSNRIFIDVKNTLGGKREILLFDFSGTFYKTIISLVPSDRIRINNKYMFRLVSKSTGDFIVLCDLETFCDRSQTLKYDVYNRIEMIDDTSFGLRNTQTNVVRILDSEQFCLKYAFAIDEGISSLKISPTFYVGLKYSGAWHLHIQSIMNKHCKKSVELKVPNDPKAILLVEVLQNPTRFTVADCTRRKLYVYDFDGDLILSQSLGFGLKENRIEEFASSGRRIAMHCPEEQRVYVIELEI